jgi:hypothetical protein
MSRINGILQLDLEAGTPDPAELIPTRDAMATRGHDGMGAWISAGCDTGLWHRRLESQPARAEARRAAAIPDTEPSHARDREAELLRRFAVDAIPDADHRWEPSADH